MDEPADVSIKSVSIKYGLILGLISILYFVVLDFAGESSNQSWNYLGYLFSLLIFYFAYKEFREEGDGYMNYGEGLGIGTLTSLVGAVVYGAFSFIYLKYINTAYLEEMKQMQMVKLEEMGMTDAEIEEVIPVMDVLMSPVSIFFINIFVAVFFGFILSLIMSAFFKNTRPEVI